MLTYVLAWVVGLGSLGLYLAAFFFPEVHRKNDFIWSGVGFFYALVLWVYAERITGAILLGQTASVALLSWLGWETLHLRRQLTPSEQQTELPDANLLKTKAQEKLTKQPEKIASLFAKVSRQIQNTLGSATTKKGKPDTTARPSQSPIAARTKEILEKDKLEAAPPQAAVDRVAPDRTVETAPVTEVEPEVEITAQSSPDKAVAEPDPKAAAEVTPTAKDGEPKTVETKIPAKGAQAKAVPPKDNLQAKLANLQEKLANLPIRQSWDKLSEQATSLFTNAKDQVQQILSRVNQRQSKPDVETTQRPAAPSTPADTPTGQEDLDFDEDEAETAPTTTAVDEVAIESVPPATETKPEVTEIAAPTGEVISSEPTVEPQPEITATEVVSEAVIEEPVLETSATGQNTDEVATESEPATASDLWTPDVEVAPAPIEEIAPEAELAPPAEPPGQPTEAEPSIEMEVIPPEATPAAPEAPISSIADSELPEAENHPKLIRPNRPDPSLIETAKRAAEAQKDTSTGAPENQE